ncbi:PREDICTED: transcription factor CP2-like [Priapulus caudatus]|uniref:Transcription factor CP2-like n=1 Tax=Priapulus caudatus TaxID=37621 RepID=A0ABM1EE18_PRICU|nr:PREDICTED: transcription factor CP2-like [Priapulus caudatus]XP_014670440.1 PREDICTED: transcription factor CP2-like [Priapulus caudatus]
MSTASPGTGTGTGSEVDGPGGLASDFDGSFSGLGVELGSSTYNMSEALLALPVFNRKDLENGFQYVLNAATSPATKVNEETLTYLNQGQSYDIRLKKLGDLSEFQGQYVKSQVRVGFHERKLQYIESEQVTHWRLAHPSDRMLSIDVPLSYGIMDVKSLDINHAEFIWDPTKEAGVYVQVHCISTEFTARKRGGEKGVPFRLQIDTFAYPTSANEEPRHLHSASCQIKVFKPKGADRKHKTDREKLGKRCGYEQEKYQPSYDCTVLSECAYDNGQASQQATMSYAAAPCAGAAEPLMQPPRCQSTPSGIGRIGSFPNMNSSASPWSGSSAGTPAMHRKDSTSSMDSLNTSATNSDVLAARETLLPSDSSETVVHWLCANRFANHATIFSNFSGTDLLRLNKEDLIEICGLADGIRLSNALHGRSVRPRLTLYLCQQSEQVYNAIFLEQLTSRELAVKTAEILQLHVHCIMDMHWTGPNGITVMITNEVVQNMKDQGRFVVDLQSLRDDMLRISFTSLD